MSALIWSDDKQHPLNPLEVAAEFGLAESALASCANHECVRIAGHRGRCASADEFKRALEEVRRVDDAD